MSMEQRRNQGPMSLAQITGSNRPLPTEPQQYQRPSLSQQDRKVVSDVFTQLQNIFPAWKHAFPTDDSLTGAKREFAKALIEAGITNLEQIAVGMRVARRQSIPFFPAPGQFIQWCEVTPESMGLPSLEQALHEVGTRRYSHPAVRLAVKATKFESQTLTANDYRPVFERAYQVLVRRVMAGEDLQAEIVKALPTREQVQHSPEYYRQVGRKGLAAVRAKLGRRSA